MYYFLLIAVFRPSFFESEYGKYFEDVVVDDSELRAFRPDIVFIHTGGLFGLFAQRSLLDLTY